MDAYTSTNEDFHLQKDSQYLSDFNKWIFKSLEEGLLESWKFNAMPNATKCLVGIVDKATTFRPLDLFQLIGAFEVLGIGLGISLVGFLFETFLHPVNRENR